MKLNFDDEKPVFLQIAEGMEDGILTGVFQEESQIPSTTELSVTYKINPATALKGINLLVDAGIVYKKRGVGVFVAEGAVRKLRQKRKDQFYENFVSRLVEEAKKLEITDMEIISMIERGFSK